MPREEIGNRKCLALFATALLAVAVPSASASEGDAPPRQPPGGRLSIDSVPRTVVWVDGEEVKPTPVLNYELEPGKHEVLLVNEERGIRKKYDIMIERGTTTKLVKRFDADGDEVKPTAAGDAGSRPPAGAEARAPDAPADADDTYLGPPPPDLVEAVQESLTRGSGCGCDIVM